MTTIASAASAIELDADPGVVWDLIGGFGSLPDWMPAIAASELGRGGRTRHLTTADGSNFVERLVSFDDADLSYTYTIAQASFPVINYLSTLRVLPQPGGSGCRVVWTGHFTPVEVPAAEAVDIFQNIYDDGLAALVSHYRP